MSIQLDPEWDRFSRRLQAFPQDLERNMRQAMTLSLLAVERDARRAAPQDTRRLAGSITHQITGSGTAIQGRVGPSVQYGRFVEFGRRPGRMPPPQALVGWVRRHSELRFARRTQAREQEVLRRAWLVARAIGRRGVRAQPYLRPAYERNRAAIRGVFARMGVRVVATLAGGPGGQTPA